MQKFYNIEILNELFETLKSLPEASEVSTYSLIKKTYRINDNEIEKLDMMKIDYELRKKAKQENIKLDSGKFNNVVVGLPCYIPYIVRFTSN